MNAENSQMKSVGDGQVVAEEGQYLCFTLGEEVYAFNILRVQEIRGWTPVRVVPDSPPYVKGVLDLRGVIVPVIDLRERFSLQHVEYSKETVVVVITIQGETASTTLGVVVDGVSDVLDLAADDIKAPNMVSGEIRDCYIEGVTNKNGKIIMLIDSDLLFKDMSNRL